MTWHMFNVKAVMADDQRPMKDAVFLDVDVQARDHEHAVSVVRNQHGAEFPELNSTRCRFRVGG